MIDQHHVDPKRDLSTDRELVLDNGNSYHIKQKPECPYGFWYISMDKGQIPDDLKGQFTSPAFAKLEIQKYLNKLGTRKIKEVKEKK